MLNKRGKYRNKQLLSIVHELPCVLCGRDKAYTQAAHANEGWLFGKGLSMKSSDAAIAALCGGFVKNGGCHGAIDQGREYSKELRRKTMHVAIVRTYEQLQERGLIDGAYFFGDSPEEIAASLVNQMESGTIVIKDR